MRGKGADIVFCTPTQRRLFNADGKSIRNSHGDFPDAMRSVAVREKVPVIDLYDMTTQLYLAEGVENSKRLLVHYPMGSFPSQQKALADDTHFSPFGAYEVAKCVVMFLLDFQHTLKAGKNTLRIEVTNLPANRISDLDRRGVKWRKMEEINVVDINYEKTTYDGWASVPSGLNSTVKLFRK